MKDEQSAIQKNCKRDKDELETTIKDLQAANAQCKGNVVTAQRDKTKVEQDYNDLNEKYQQVNKDLEQAQNKRAADRAQCDAQLSNLQAKLDAAVAGHSIPQEKQQEGNNNLKSDSTVKQETESQPKVDENVAQVAPPKDHEEEEKKEDDTMQVAPPKPEAGLENEIAEEKAEKDMQVNPPKYDFFNLFSYS